MSHLRPKRPIRPTAAVFKGLWAGFVGRFFPVLTKAAQAAQAAHALGNLRLRGPK